MKGSQSFQDGDDSLFQACRGDDPTTRTASRTNYFHRSTLRSRGALLGNFVLPLHKSGEVETRFCGGYIRSFDERDDPSKP